MEMEMEYNTNIVMQSIRAHNYIRDVWIRRWEWERVSFQEKEREREMKQPHHRKEKEKQNANDEHVI